MRITKLFVVISAVLTITSCGGGTAVVLCDNSSIITYNYLMAFQGCMEGCDDPRNHTVYLAGSDDGVTWTLISAFEPMSGSVPALVFYDDFLYIFHTQGTNNWEKLNACFEVVESGDAVIVGDDQNGWVDPSLIVSGDSLHLFYLPGQANGDPAGCGGDYPCTREIHSAIADDSTLTDFTQQPGNRASQLIQDAAATIQIFADPDILELDDGTFLLYVSIGGSSVVYQGTSLADAFTIPGGGAAPLEISTNGGVPGALQAPDGSVWLYVTTNSLNGSTITRGISADGITPIADGDFVTAIDHTISSDLSEGASISSASVIDWPGDTWSREQASQ